MRRAVLGVLGLALGGLGACAAHHEEAPPPQTTYRAPPPAPQQPVRVTIKQNNSRAQLEARERELARARAAKEDAARRAAAAEAEAERLAQQSQAQSQQRAQALEEAEQSRREAEAMKEELAQRQAALAEAERSQQQAAQDLARQQELAAQQRQAAQEELAAERERASRELAEQKEQLASREKELQQAQAEREQAEARAKEALQQVANVKEEARGLVVTLNGSVLFAFNQDTLLPDARRRLDVVADVLKQTPNQVFRIEGYTDSIGSEAYNLELSQRRADAVRNYLMERGLSSEQLASIGYGEYRAVADNRTPEGRANNRRVEIVLPKGAAPTGVGGSGGAGEQRNDEAGQGTPGGVQAPPPADDTAGSGSESPAPENQP